jgi:hypothetical protein
MPSPIEQAQVTLKLLHELLSISTKHYEEPHEINSYLKNIIDLAKIIGSTPEIIGALLRQHDGDFWTIGHFISADQTDPAVLQAFIALLDYLIKNEPEAAIRLLQQTSNGWTIGHLIAANQTDPAVLQAFIALLDYLIKNHPEEAIRLLQQETDDGWHMGHFIARYQTDPAVAQAYIALLNCLMTNHSEAVIRLLQLQTDKRWSIGHAIIASHSSDPAVLQAYIALLHRLTTQYLEEVTLLLQQQTDYGSNIGHLIAANQTNPAVLQAFIALLDHLIKNHPEEAIRLLQQQTDDRFNIGHLIATDQTDPAVLQAFIALLDHLIKNFPEEAIRLLQQWTHNGWSIGHCIARYQTDPAVVQALIALLDRLMISHPKKAIHLLQQQTKDGSNIGRIIVLYQKKTIKDYFNVLQKLPPQYIVKLLPLLIYPLPGSDDFELQVKINATPANLRPLLTETEHINAYGKLFCAAVVAILKDPKHIKTIDIISRVRLTHALLDLPINEPNTLELLRRCVDEKNSLGKLFNISTGQRIPTIFRSRTTTMPSHILARLAEVTKAQKATTPPPLKTLTKGLETMSVVPSNENEEPGFEMQDFKQFKAQGLLPR